MAIRIYVLNNYVEFTDHELALDYIKCTMATFRKGDLTIVWGVDYKTKGE